jgi:hypothetical protein
MTARLTFSAALLPLILVSFAGDARAQDPPSEPSMYRGFAGGAALASVQPTQFATRITLNGVPDETKPVFLIVGGCTMPHGLAVQGEVSGRGQFDHHDGSFDVGDGSEDVEWRDMLASALVRWRVARYGVVSFEPVGGLTFAFSQGRRRLHDDDGWHDGNVDVTRGGIVVGGDVSIAIARHVDIVPTFRLHRIADVDRRVENDWEPWHLRDASNVYRFGIGGRWTF